MGIMPWVFSVENFGGIRLAALKNIQQFADIIGHKKLKGGVLLKYGAEVLAPGVIRSGIPKETRNIIGNSNTTSITPDLEEIKSIYAETGLSLEIGHIKTAIIAKLGFNFLNSLFPTIYGQTEFDLGDNHVVMAIKKRAREYYLFADCLGVELAPTADEYADKAIGAVSITAGLVPSALQDLRNGKRTEKEQYKEQYMEAVIEIASKDRLDLPNIKAMYGLLTKVEEACGHGPAYLQDFQNELYAQLKRIQPGFPAPVG